MQYLEDDQTVARYAPYRKQMRNEKGRVIGLLPVAFEMRADRDETALSVNWLEYFGNSYPANFNGLMDDLKTFRSLGANGAFGLAAVGQMTQALERVRIPAVRVARDSRDSSHPNPSHARIINLPINSLTAMQALAAAFNQIIECRHHL